MFSVCDGCLSSDRVLSHVQPAIHSLLEVILNQATSKNVKDMTFCWECTAVIRKLRQFQHRAVKVQQWLQRAHTQWDCEGFSKSTTLSTLHTVVRTSHEHIPAEKENYLLQEDAIKIETTDPFQNFIEVTHTEEFDSFSDIPSVKYDHDVSEIKEEFNKKDDSKTFIPFEHNIEHKEKIDIEIDIQDTEDIVKQYKKESKNKENHVQLNKDTEFKTETVSAVDRRRKTKKRKTKKCAKAISANTKIKPLHQCTECDLKFAYRCNLIDHSRTHTGEKPHECTHCGKKYTQTASLNRHIRSHTGDKRYKCSYCGLSFLERKSLTDHCNIHTGEKPHLCSICGKRFTQRAALRTHFKIHQPYECIICNVRFKTKSQLKDHKC